MKKEDFEKAFPPAPEGFEDAVRNALNQTRRLSGAPAAQRRLRGIRLPVLAALMAALLAIGGIAYGLLAPGYTLMLNEEYHQQKSMAAIDDTLYVSDGLKLVSYHPGDGDYITLIDKIITHDTSGAPELKELRRSPYYIDLLCSIDGQLCGMNAVSGLLFNIDWRDGQGVYSDRIKLRLKSNMSPTVSGEPMGMFTSVVQDGMLYYIQRDMFGDEIYRLAAYDLATGEGGLRSVREVREIAAYRDGLLLALVENQTSVSLCAYDPQNDTLQTLRTLTDKDFGYGDDDSVLRDLGGLQYSAAKDCAYLTDRSGFVYALPELKKVEKVAAISAFSFSYYLPGGHSALLNDTYYCTCDPDGLYIRNLDAGYQEPLLLGLSANLRDDTLRAASQRTGIDVNTESLQTDYASLQELLLTKDSVYDLYVVTTDSADLAALRDKGYLPAAPDLPELSAYADALYPLLRDAFLHDGRLCAVPLDLSVNVSYINTEMQERLGIENAPTNLSALLALLNAWGSGQIPEAAYGDFITMDSISRDWLVSLALDQYDRECAAQGVTPTLDDASLRDALAAVDAFDLTSIEDINFNDEMEFQAVLLNINTAFQPAVTANSLLPFTLAGGEAPVPCTVTFAFVNPFSRHQESAWQYLEALAASLPKLQQTLMCPALNEPVESPSWPALQADLQSMFAKFPGDPTYLAELDYCEKNMRYDFPAQNIALYRELMERAYLTSPYTLVQLLRDSGSVLDRYIDRSISLDQFIEEGNRILSLRRTELQ